ncbi:MAG: alpha/beta fold hydrolase, partial [Rhodobacteraceae bacterium]|nr:alpha/beta fold hydrolase [Paracoccaceae bacterium]
MLSKLETCPYTIEGTGPAMFLIHGIGASRETWKNLVPTLRNHFTVISYDLRGHGLASLPGKKLSLDDLVDDLEQIRCEINIDRAHFVGHSLGGMIGPAYARKYPERVISLGLLSTAAFRTSDDSTKVWKVVKAMESRGIPQILETLTDRWFTDEFIQSHPEVVEKRLNQVIAT